MTRLRKAPVPRFALVVLATLSGIALLLCASTSGAANKAHKAPATACVAAWNGAEARSEAGHLLQARDLLLSCAKPTCGPVTMKQCFKRLAQLESDIPTVVPVVTDEAGAPVVDVEVRSGGEILASRLDGRGLLVDPGVHEFSFSAAGHGVFATERLMILEGQRNRLIAVSLSKASGRVASIVASVPNAEPAPDKQSAREDAPTEPSPPTPDDAPPAEPPPSQPGGKRFTSLLPYVIGGVGLASIGAGALMTLWGNQDNAALSSCSPNCIPADTAHIRALYIASDITFGAGAAALGVAAVLYLTSRSHADGRSAPHAAYVFDLEPTRAGAFASIKGAF